MADSDHKEKKPNSSERKQSRGVWEQRAMYVAFVTGMLAGVILLISVCTDRWVTVTLAYGQYRNDTGRGGAFYKTGHYHGLWRICRQEYVNVSDDDYFRPYHRLFCRTMYYFSMPPDVKFGIYDNEILLYRRSSAAISLLGLVLAVIANSFTWYSLHQLRYMFKRLAASLHLIAGACCWVTVEVFKRSLDYELAHLTIIVPPGSDISYGFSYVLCWVSFVLFLIVGVAVFVCSRKRKGQKAYNVREAQENEPIVLGRL